MKKIRLLALLWVILITGTLVGCWSNKQSDNNSSDVAIEDITWQTDEVITYNDKLVELASQCIISESDIWNAYDDNSSTEDIQEAISSTIAKCSNISEEINKLWDWEWDSSLKNGVLDVIQKEIAYYTKFSEIIPYIGQGEITEEENSKYESLLSEIETLDKELNESNDNLMTIQEEFAKNHGFQLEANEETDNDIIIEETAEEETAE